MNDFIQFKNVCFEYKKTGFKIEDFSLCLHSGETTVLAGHNGCGKTTVSKLLLSILKPHSGDVFIDGKSVNDMRLADISKHVGYLFQQPDRQLFCQTAIEEITFSFIQNGTDEQTSVETAKQLLEKFGLSEKACEYPLMLSRGEKQRLAFAAVYAMKPKFYVLDEPSSGLDVENKQSLMGLIKSLKQQGVGFLIITHDKEMMTGLADRMITMHKGRIIKDETA